MEIEINQELLDEINIFLNSGKLIDCMQKNELTIEAMSVILQSIISTVDDLQKRINKNEEF